MKSTELVAEVGLSHDGSLGIAHSYIDICSKIGIDTIKFQMHIPEAESSNSEKFRIPFSYQDKTRYQYWERTGFSIEQWVSLKKHCENKKINFLVSAFSIKALENLENIGCKRVKLGSAETIDPLILKLASKKNLDIILSTGFAGDDIFQIISKFDTFSNLTILECVSKYPSQIEDFNLDRFKKLKNIKDLKVGLSDHSSAIDLPLFLLSQGVDMIEAHIVFNKEMFGPDSSSSLDPKQWSKIVAFRNQIETLNFQKENLKINENMKKTFSRSLTYKKNLKKGSILSIEDFESTKVDGEGISTKRYEEFINKKLSRNVNSNDLVKKEDFV